MSINQFPSDIPETLWWAQQQPIMEANPNTHSSTNKFHSIPQQNNIWAANQIYNQRQLHHHHHQQQQQAAWLAAQNRNPTLNFNLNQQEDEELEEQFTTDERENIHQQDDEEVDEREPMFEKPLTPSDVGKLNRLVIPKQHAEKYFPLNGDSTDKGLLLSFEDESGKSWRFRYSYWNSSQSYVLTKGWSRYVKEKKLDAGDVVLFERHPTDGDRMFIGWRRRATQAQDSGSAQPTSSAAAVALSATGTTGGATPGWSRVFYSAHPYPSHPLPYQPDCLHAGSSQIQRTPAGNSKRLRLFGVNLECQLDESTEPATPDGSSSTNQGGQTHYQFYPQVHGSSSTSQYNTHMDINFPGNVNHMSG